MWQHSDPRCAARQCLAAHVCRTSENDQFWIRADSAHEKVICASKSIVASRRAASPGEVIRKLNSKKNYQNQDFSGWRDVQFFNYWDRNSYYLQNDYWTVLRVKWKILKIENKRRNKTLMLLVCRAHVASLTWKRTSCRTNWKVVSRNFDESAHTHRKDTVEQDEGRNSFENDPTKMVRTTHFKTWSLKRKIQTLNIDFSRRYLGRAMHGLSWHWRKKGKDVQGRTRGDKVVLWKSACRARDLSQWQRWEGRLVKVFLLCEYWNVQTDVLEAVELDSHFNQ